MYTNYIQHSFESPKYFFNISNLFKFSFLKSIIHTHKHEQNYQRSVDALLTSISHKLLKIRLEVEVLQEGLVERQDLVKKWVSSKLYRVYSSHFWETLHNRLISAHRKWHEAALNGFKQNNVDYTI